MSKLQEILGAELFASVTTAMGERQLAIVSGDGADGTWIPKQKFEDARLEATGLKTQLAERDTQLQTLSEAAKGSEELTAKITELETANATTATEHAAALRDAKVNAAVDLALVKAGALNAKAVMPFVDRSKLELAEDGTVKGLDDAMKGLVEGEDTKFLFGTTDALTSKKSADGGASGAGANPFKVGATFNLTEQSRITLENPELAEKLQAEATA